MAQNKKLNREKIMKIVKELMNVTRKKAFIYCSSGKNGNLLVSMESLNLIWNIRLAKFLNKTRFSDKCSIINL